MDELRLILKFYPKSNFIELKRKGLVEGDFRYEEDECMFRITERGYAYLNNELLVPLGVSEDFIKEYRDLFSKSRIGIAGKQGDSALVKKNLVAFMNEYKINEDQLLKLANAYIDTVKDPTYIMQADYCLYKEKSGVKTSKLGEFFEAMEEETKKKIYNWA